jgi:hypothetical protein
MRHAVQLAGVETGIAENDLKIVPGGRVTLARGLDIAPNAL